MENHTDNIFTWLPIYICKKFTRGSSDTLLVLVNNSLRSEGTKTNFENTTVSKQLIKRFLYLSYAKGANCKTQMSLYIRAATPETF